MTEIEIIRDPLWDNIRLDPGTLAVLDTPVVQRLRYIRQVGHAFLVYPGATHSRFEHALGAFHLIKKALWNLEQRGDLEGIAQADRDAVRLAALLHDIGHYPFSHGLEEAGLEHHERLGANRLETPELKETIAAFWPDLSTSVLGDLIRGRSISPLQGLISGSIDLDKIDYLNRDARMCGVPYGNVDVDRLLASLTLVETPGGTRELGVLEKGMSALESLLFAKYQMYRNVYWHHGVRSATCMFKRAVRRTLAIGALDPTWLSTATDGALVERLLAADPTGLAQAVNQRRLYKRAVDLPAGALSHHENWPAEDPDLLEQVEDRVASEVGLPAGSLLIDFPSRGNMLGVNLPVRLRDGTVDRLTQAGRPGHLGLPGVAEILYQSARRLRVFVAELPERGLDRVTHLIAMSAEEIRDRLAAGGPLLA